MHNQRVNVSSWYKLFLFSVLTYKDIPGKNEMNPGEFLLVEKSVTYYGQPVALVIAGKLITFKELCHQVCLYSES